MGVFADTIMRQKYLWEENGETEWKNIAYRTTKNIMKSVGIKMSHTLAKEIFKSICDRKFIPGGRYLYASGRPYHQVQNCLLMKAGDSRESWADTMHKAGMALMTGAGIGIDYSDIRGEGKLIRKTGGIATGPIALMKAINEFGRQIMQGGSRRSAIWAGLNWKHPDVYKFIHIKNWSEDVKKLKEKDFNFPATLDGTNISVQLDDEFFEAYHNDKHILHSHAQSVYWAVIRQMLQTAEPGFSIDVGKNKGETLRNACVTGDTEILTRDGYKKIENLTNKTTEIWNGFEWSEVIPKITGTDKQIYTVILSNGMELNCTDNHKFVIALDYKGNTKKLSTHELKPGMKLIKHNYPVIEHGENFEHAYTQGFISAEGMKSYNYFYVYDTKYCCISRLSAIMVGSEFTSFTGVRRQRFKPIFNKLHKSFVPFSWNLKSKLDWLAGLFDGDGCELKEGGLQLASTDKQFLLNVQKLLTTLGTASKVVGLKSAGWTDLPDGKGGFKKYNCKETSRICIGAKQIQYLNYLGLNCERLTFHKTPNRDASRFIKVVDVIKSYIADKVYCFTEHKRNLGCFNGIITGQCTEISSYDDSDICNIGSINMSRIESLSEMRELVNLAIPFLLAGTVYSDVPYAKVDEVRTKNRRLGLGLMGIHEWLLKKGKTYGPDSELEEYLKVYAESTNIAKKWAKEWDLSEPIKTRAIAPTGSIGILAETTTGIEPIFCVAYKRRYLKHTTWHYQYVVDPTAKKLIDYYGVKPENIEDAFILAENVEKRVKFQRWVQKYVDHGISSTINLPAWGSSTNNDSTVRKFGNMLIKYLPELRGITVYPDGARNGQPLVPIKYSTAMKHEGKELIEDVVDICSLTGKGACGS